MGRHHERSINRFLTPNNNRIRRFFGRFRLQRRKKEGDREPYKSDITIRKFLSDGMPDVTRNRKLSEFLSKEQN